MNNKIKCPECGSDYISHLSYTDLIPIKEQYMFGCNDCWTHFNVKEKEVETIMGDETGVE